LVVQLSGEPAPLPPELTARSSPAPLAVPFEDSSRIPLVPGKVEGGAAVLTAQSQCPFKAFATARLAAKGWEAAETGLTAAQRGQLLHGVLNAVWGGPPLGIRNLEELRTLPDWEAFVADHVRRAAQTQIPAHLRARMPRRYLELEEQRLTRLITEWLDYEATRVEFGVIETEARCSRTIAGLTFDLRLDRIDRLNDHSLLVVDYKSGDVKPSLWDLPRPEDVQLPLYAGFALNSGEELGGLVFAKVRAGDSEFAGCVGDAQGTLLASLSSTKALVKNSLSAERLIDWRNCIERLARDFLEGKAEVNPRDYPKTCERCGLQALCRVQENRARLESGDDSDVNVEAGDE
jgi:ATP-dependent helicase/DNAse subunit B